MLKLQWLQIHKFRSVKPGTRLVFNPTYNVLLGQNGTGKTTLLNLVAAVVGSDFKALRDEEYELEYELASEAGRIQVAIRNVRSSDSPVSLREPFNLRSVLIRRDMAAAHRLSAEIKAVAPDGSPTFSIAFAGTRMTVRRGHERSTIIRELDLPTPSESLGSVLSFGVIEWAKANAGVEKLLSVYTPFTEFWNGNSQGRFDESLGYFDQLKNIEFTFLRLGKQGGAHFVRGGAPDVVVNELARQIGASAEAKSLAITSDKLPFLDDLARLLNFKSAEVLVELHQSNMGDDSEFLDYGGLRFLFVRPGGSRISEQHLSYGQKRMLAFMYYQATARSIVIADELVNGLHHRWIRACLEVLGDRQVFLTSQNPLLLDYLTFDSAEQVRSTFVLSRWEEEGGGQMVWEDMSNEAAEDFFASYKVGFQQVGELLQSKGLW
jgi:energy-coupling factor transporter ATP-binding protein EcfA2